MKRNVKKIILELNSISLKKFRTIPTFKLLLRKPQLESLRVGKNELMINHYVFSKLQNLQGPGNYKIYEIKE